MWLWLSSSFEKWPTSFSTLEILCIFPFTQPPSVLWLLACSPENYYFLKNQHLPESRISGERMDIESGTLLRPPWAVALDTRMVPTLETGQSAWNTELPCVPADSGADVQALQTQGFVFVLMLVGFTEQSCKYVYKSDACRSLTFLSAHLWYQHLGDEDKRYDQDTRSPFNLPPIANFLQENQFWLLI